MDLGKKMISVEQALSLVKSNDHIVSALAPAEGAAFLGSLHTIADRVKNVTVTSCLPMGNFEYMTNRAYADSFNVDGWFFTPALRKAHAKRQRQSRAAAAFHGGIETSLSSEMQYIYRQLLYARQARIRFVGTVQHI